MGLWSLPRWHPPNYSIFLALLRVSSYDDVREPSPRQPIWDWSGANCPSDKLFYYATFHYLTLENTIQANGVSGKLANCFD